MRSPKRARFHMLPKTGCGGSLSTRFCRPKSPPLTILEKCRVSKLVCQPHPSFCTPISEMNACLGRYPGFIPSAASRSGSCRKPLRRTHRILSVIQAGLSVRRAACPPILLQEEHRFPQPQRSSGNDDTKALPGQMAHLIRPRFCAQFVALFAPAYSVKPPFLPRSKILDSPPHAFESTRPPRSIILNKEMNFYIFMVSDT
jgi:hypothetical protein